MQTSVCLSTRNKAPVLDQVLASIRRQSIPFEYEIVVADDGSTDNTREVCRKHGVVYRFLDNNRYRNPARARNDAYRAAKGDVIIAQSDDVIHHSGNTVEALTTRLQENAVLISQVRNMIAGTDEPCHTPFHFYSGPRQPRAFFFLGALWRKDIYLFGGNDENFVEPCWDDNWFQDCLLRGLKLKLTYAEDIEGWHQSHNFPSGSHDLCDITRDYYHKIAKIAAATNDYRSPGAPWPRTWPTIPKRMSFFWGGDKLSWMRYLTLASFRKHHPDWEIVLYRYSPEVQAGWASYEKEDATAYTGSSYWDRLPSLDIRTVNWSPPVKGLTATHASDLCEWEILSKEGGFYSDMDILYVRPIDYDDWCQGDVLTCLSRGYFTIGFFGASAASPVFAAIQDRAMGYYQPNRYQSTGAEAIYAMTGEAKIWAIGPSPGRVAVNRLRDRFNWLRFREVQETSFYPFDWEHVPAIFEEDHEVGSDTVGVHWFGGNPLAQKWNNLLTPDCTYRNTFTRYAREIEGL